MSTPLFDLSGRVAIITGGAGLLASEHALALSEFGATIVLADFNEEKCTTAVDELQKQDVKAVAKFCVVAKAAITPVPGSGLMLNTIGSSAGGVGVVPPPSLLLQESITKLNTIRMVMFFKKMEFKIFIDLFI